MAPDSNRGHSGGSEPDVEIRNLRVVGTTPNTVHFRDRATYRELRMLKAEWIALGKPTYVVVSVRCETFAESTQ